MEKLDSLNQVAEFHKTFNAPILDTPQIPSKERATLRVSLLQEELDELKKAIKDKNCFYEISSIKICTFLFWFSSKRQQNLYYWRRCFLRNRCLEKIKL